MVTSRVRYPKGTLRTVISLHFTSGTINRRDHMVFFIYS